MTSPLRAPFTVFEGTSGPAELAKDVRDGDGRLKTVGELISCPFCIGMWVSTGFTTGHIFMPRATRFAATTLAALAGSDFLPFAYAYAEQHAGWRTPAGAPRPSGVYRRRSVALATLATIAANGGMTRATADMMTAASMEYRSTTAHATTNRPMQTPIRTK